MMKKAQGALEFLMTYGWAFLVILIMIGALAYFGVLSPTKFLPERCTFGSQFLCKDYVITLGSTSANVTVKLQNNLGQAIYINEDSSDVMSQEGFGTCVMNVTDNDGVDIAGTELTAQTAVPDGGYFIVHGQDCSTLGGMTSGSKYKLALDLNYYAATSSEAFSNTVQGEVFANVE